MIRLEETPGRRGKRKEKERERDLDFWNTCRKKEWHDAIQKFNSDSNPTRDQSWKIRDPN